MKKFFSVLLATCLLAPMCSFAQNIDIWDGETKTPFVEEGRGDADNPFLIESAAHLAYLADQVFYGNNLYAGKYFRLTTDIDLNEHEWLPIGYHFTNAINSHFKGSFDGDAHKIYNLTITKPIKIPNPTDESQMIDVSTCALFGAIEGKGRGAELGGVSLTDLGIESGAISVGATVAALVGWAAGVSINSCYNKANLEGTSYVAGIVAYPVSPSVDVMNCYNMGNLMVTANATANKAIGGIIGATTTAYILNCYNFGNITVNGSIPAGTWGGLTGTYQASREPINAYYVETCISGGNTRGTKYTEQEMLDPLFVLTINNDQEPVKWITDEEMLNYGLPILSWEAPMPSGVEDIVHSDAPAAVYSVLGQYMGTDINALPRGIYIQNGKKIMIQDK